MRALRIAPVTAECLIICAALFAVCHTRSLDVDAFEGTVQELFDIDPGLGRIAESIRREVTGVPFRDAQRQWGAALMRQSIRSRASDEVIVDSELRGPFDVWDGDWWRIPASAFHHVDFFHLLTNCLAAWFLGKRLENRWGSLRYLLFLFPAVTIPLLLEFVAGNVALGFSGAICAMLGALVVLQHIDPRDDDLPEEVTMAMLCLILLGIPATALDIMPIANIAHISGVAYGGLTAWACSRQTQPPQWVRAAFLASHLLVIPVLVLAVHPLGDARYLWYLAERDGKLGIDEREGLLRLALQKDPSLTEIWLQLADRRATAGELMEAWTLLAEGLSQNPGNNDLFEVSRRIWRRLNSGQRELALVELERIFGDQAATWSQQIRGVPTSLAKAGSHKGTDEEPDPKDFPLDRPVDLQLQFRQADPPAPGLPDPELPDSAVEGTAL